MAGLQNSTLVDTPLEVNVKLSQDNDDLLSNPTLHLHLVGGLVYLTIPRLDISHVVKFGGSIHDGPQVYSFGSYRCIIRYLLGTSSGGLFFHILF